MAVGAKDEYWDDARLPGVLKHGLLKRYLPVFLLRTASTAGRAAYLDGFAGRGKYANGDLGSAGQMLEFAVGQLYSRNVPIDLYLCEKQRDSYAILAELCGKYRSRGVTVTARRDDAAEFLRDSLPSVAAVPTFIFLDPCGVGIPHSDLIGAANRGANSPWPPTEFLINFSLEALRRIGGHVTSDSPNQKTMERLDVSLGGPWWRDHFDNGVSDDAVNAVLTEYVRRLGQETRMGIVGVPVKRSPSHKPIYYLIFGSRHQGGIWNFAHCAAKAQEDWWSAVRARDEAAGELSLFDPTPQLKTVESAAMPDIAENIANLMAERGPIRVGDFPGEIFGIHLGLVRESVVRQAVKHLHRQGRTPSTGVGGKVEDLRVVPAS